MSLVGQVNSPCPQNDDLMMFWRYVTALQSNATSTDSNLSRLPPVDNSTDKEFVASGSKSAALEPDKPQENPAVPLHLLTSKPQQGEMIQDIDASIPEPVVEESAHSSLRDPERVSRASNIQSAGK